MVSSKTRLAWWDDNRCSGTENLSIVFLGTFNIEIWSIENLLHEYVVCCEDGVISGLLSKPCYENYSAERGRRSYEVPSASNQEQKLKILPRAEEFNLLTAFKYERACPQFLLRIDSSIEHPPNQGFGPTEKLQ